MPCDHIRVLGRHSSDVLSLAMSGICESLSVQVHAASGRRPNSLSPESDQGETKKGKGKVKRQRSRGCVANESRTRATRREWRQTGTRASTRKAVDLARRRGPLRAPLRLLLSLEVVVERRLSSFFQDGVDRERGPVESATRPRDAGRKRHGSGHGCGRCCRKLCALRSAAVAARDRGAGGGLRRARAAAARRPRARLLHSRRRIRRHDTRGPARREDDWQAFRALHQWASAANVRIVAPTLPGFGLSGAVAGYSVEAWVADAEALLEHLGISDFHVLGTSLGSIYAVALASLHEPRASVRNVMLYVAFAPEDRGAGHDPLGGSILESSGKLRTQPRLKHVLEALLMRPLLGALAPPETRRAIKWQWEGLADCARIIYAPWREPWRDLAEGRRVIVVSGTRDEVAPPANQRRLVAQIAGAELVEYDGLHGAALVDTAMFARHVQTLERVGETLLQLREFCAAHRIFKQHGT